MPAFMLLAVSKRDNEDDRTLGELFYIMISEVADITYHESMQIIVEAMLATVQEEFHILRWCRRRWRGASGREEDTAA